MCVRPRPLRRSPRPLLPPPRSPRLSKRLRSPHPAVYFRGNWATAFKKTATADDPFQTDGRAVNVPTMHRTENMSYAENDDVRLVEIPYKDSDLTMLIALPQKADKLGAIEAQLTGGQVDGGRRPCRTRTSASRSRSSRSRGAGR